MESTRLEADLTAGGGAADVTVEFLLAEGDPSGVSARPLTLELLGFDPATTDHFVLEDGRSVVLWPTRGSHRAASIVPAPGPGPTLISIGYRIEDAVTAEDGRLHVRIPVLTGPPAGTGDGIGSFEARLIVPEGWSVSEGFPSGLREQENGIWLATLATPPSMVGFRGRSDGASRPGLPFIVDVMTLVFLAGFSIVGWRHLSGVARSARA